MENPFKNDPFSITWEAFKSLYPEKECVCWFDNDIRADDGDKAYGLTSFEEDGSIQVFVDANIAMENATEVFAHELAHVAVGFDHGHDAEWESAFESILNEYEKICEKWFGGEADEPAG